MDSLFAQIPDSVFRFGRIQENTDWFWPIVVTLLLLWYVVRRYRKDAADLRRWLRGLLALLRVAVVLVLLLFYLQPQWERLDGASRVVFLIDTSASMSNRDVLPTAEVVAAGSDAPSLAIPDGGNARGPTRLESLADWLERTDLVRRLREKHDVAIYRFDRTLDRVLLETKGDSFVPALSPGQSQSVPTTTEVKEAAEPEDAEAVKTEGTPAELKGDPEKLLRDLLAEGDQTRLGEALLEVLHRERGEPLSGLVLLSDGGQNAGPGVETALDTAVRTLLPIHTVGIGALRQPLNFRALSIDTAERAFPGDPFKVRSQIEFAGGETTGATQDAAKLKLPVELLMKPLDDDNATEIPLSRQEVEIAPGSVAGVDFEVRREEVGKYRLILRIVAPPEDHMDEDNVVETEIEIVDRKDRVLIYAGGPGRDYQFLLSQIHRDKSMQVDVYIPWAASGASQSADTILPLFPQSFAEIAPYDCIVAFDPDWSELSSEEISALEHWVARQGGGLIVVGGNVNMGNALTGWTSDPQTAKIRALYPVEFPSRGTAGEMRYHAQATPMSLQFTRAGDEAEYLRPTDDEGESRAVWNEFPGFYGYSTVKGIKPTATLLAGVAADLVTSPEQAAMFVEQYYGAGHVLYIGSPEIWRLRRLDPVYFEKLYTKMIRHVSQGRLQRQSDRGSLTTDKRRYSLGSVATLRATANDAQLQPLELPSLEADAVSPGGKIRTVRMTLDPNAPGSYQGHLPLTEEGDWALSLHLPDTQEKLLRTITVRMSDLERESISRNETLLKQLAEKSGGRYFASPGIAQTPLRESALYGRLFMNDRLEAEKDAVPTTVGEELPPELLDLLKVRSQRAVPDLAAQRSLATLFLAILAALLLIEWTLRRLARLA